MQIKKFSKNDCGFTCAACGAEVEPLGYTSRDHCPVCLHSLHVDINPGDRENPCHGLLKPLYTLTDPKKGFVIVYRCERCKELVRNRAAQDDDTALLIKMTNPDEAEKVLEKKMKK